MPMRTTSLVVDRESMFAPRHVPLPSLVTNDVPARRWSTSMPVVLGPVCRRAAVGAVCRHGRNSTLNCRIGLPKRGMDSAGC